MRRRDFIKGIVGSTAWPLAVGAQQSEQTRRIGVLMNRTADNPEGQARVAVREFANDSFLLVRFGDHQPDFASSLIDPTLDQNGIIQRLIAYDPRYFTTYYAIDAVNFRPVDVSSAFERSKRPIFRSSYRKPPVCR